MGARARVGVQVNIRVQARFSHEFFRRGYQARFSGEDSGEIFSFV
jgi:hypothetical protein